MTRPLKPPRGIFIATQVIFHPDLSPALKDTLLRLMALAWASGGRYTPPLSYPQLASLTGRSISTIYAHLSELRNRHAVLRLQSAADGNVIILFSDAFLPPQRTPPLPVSETSELPDQEEEEKIGSQDDVLLPDDLDHHAKKLRKSGKTARLSAKLTAELQEAGVFATLLDEIAASGRSEKDLRALLAWTRDEQPANPAPLFIARLRIGARAPERFYQPPCPSCGRYGKHAENCRRRFVDDTYAEFVEF